MRKTSGFLANARPSIVAVGIATILVGCALPAHNNTLIFSVQRKIGIDITPTNGTNAGLTIGYSSNEFAWVPLWANGPDGKPFVDCGRKGEEWQMADQAIKATQQPADNSPKDLNFYCASSPKFVGHDAEGLKNGSDKDSYSVFASFGGDVGGKTEGGAPSAGLKVASFFATGIAAQSLAQGDASSLVSVGGTPQEKKVPPQEYKTAKAVQAFLEASAIETSVTEACKVTLLKAWLPTEANATERDSLVSKSKGLSARNTTETLLKLTQKKSGVDLARLETEAEVLTIKFADAKEKQEALITKEAADYIKKNPAKTPQIVAIGIACNIAP